MTKATNGVGLERSRHQPVNPPKRRLVYGVIVAVAGLFSHTLLVASVPYSAWVGANSYIPRDDIRVLLPQGWGFFTRDPREARIIPFGLDTEGEWTELGLGPHSRARWLFGLDRRSRAQGLEIGTLFGAVPDDAWVDCDSGPTSMEPRACLDAASPLQVDNPSPIPSLCGQIGLVRREPVPWAWRGAADQIEMPAQVLRLDVRCRR